MRGSKGGGGRNVRRRVRLPCLRSRAYDLPLPRATFNRGEIQAPLPSFLNSSRLLPPRSLQSSALIPPLFSHRRRRGNVFLYISRSRFIFPARGRVSFLFSSFPPPTSCNPEKRSCEQFFFLSSILQILHACECLLHTVTRSLSGESRENDGRKGEGRG